MKRIIALVFLVFLVTRCESSGTGEPTDIPDVVIDCQNTKCSSVSTGIYDVVINITSSGCADDQIPLAPVVAGTATITCTNGLGCSGTVSVWRDTNSNTTTQIPSSTYSICGWIDLDGLSTKNAGDAYAEDNRLVSKTISTLTLSDWDAQNERSTRRVPFR